MAQITFTDLAAQLPASSLTQSVDDVSISLKALMGETSVQLTDDKVIEFAAKLMQAAFNAQTVRNADVANLTDVTSFSQPFPGVITTIGGSLFVPIAQQFSYLAPIGIDTAIGAEI